MNGLKSQLMKQFSVCASVLIICAGQSTPVSAANEQQLSQTVSTQISQGNPVWLNTSSGKFLAIFDKELSIAEKGTAILLPSLNDSVNASGIMRQLRTMLPQFGWTTLALQLPLLDESSSSIYDYIDMEGEINTRLTAAINFIMNKGSKNIIIIGKGIGAAAGANFLAKNNNGEINALIGISMTGYHYQESWIYSPSSLARITLPILDIYGSQDHINVINSASDRMEASKQANQESIKEKLSERVAQLNETRVAQERQTGRTVYTQLTITGADNDFNGLTRHVSKKILGWLKNYAGGINLNI